MTDPRRLLEPRDWFDRMLYATGVIFLPFSIEFAWRIKEGLAASVFLMFWLVMAFYTVEWVWKKRKA